YKAEVARVAIDAGASIVNDISGLSYDSALASVVATSGSAVVLMHIRGGPQTMYQEAVYKDVAVEGAAGVNARIVLGPTGGVAADRIIVDPGIGFAKRPEHSYGVLARLEQIAAVTGRPLLIGPSRKSFMTDALDERQSTERDWGTAAAVTAAVLAGAHI